MFIKCACQSCRENIEVESDYLGQAINCPHCGQPTALNPIKPTAGVREFNPQFIQAAPSKPKSKRPWIIGACVAACMGIAVALIFKFDAELGAWMMGYFVAALLIGVAVAFYFLPYIIARASNRKNAGAIFMLNLLLGWSGLGWIIAIVWACVDDK